MIYLDLDDVLHLAEGTAEHVVIRDVGLLQSAVARPQASPFGNEAYPTLHTKAAALLHSLARNHPLVDGNKRLALAATIAFYGVNGFRLTFTNDRAYELIIAVAGGDLDDVDAISHPLAAKTAKRRRQ